MKIIFTIFSLLLSGCVAQSQLLNKISREISSCQVNNGIKKNGNDMFNEVRLKLDKLNKLNFVTSAEQNFLLETYNIETGTIYGLIWNNKGELNYSYYQGKFSFDDDLIFTDFIIKLVENWNIDSIRKEEKVNSNMIPTNIIYASRITKNGTGGSDIDCIKFKDFFKLERDR